MATIAFLGQGHMGVPMAGRLVDAGHRTTVWNRTPDRCSVAAGKGATIAETPAKAVEGADIVITMLSDAAAVDAVLFGEHGAAAAISAGTVLLEMSTIGPDAVRDLRARLRADIALVDAPVVGSIPQATAGELRILAGGTEDDLARSAEVLAVLGSVGHLGPLGAGAGAKLVANLITITSMTLIGEALALGDRLGLTQDQTMDLLGKSALGGFAERIRGRIGDPDTPTNFGLGLAEKDLGLALAAGAPPAGIAAAARQHLAAAKEAGLAERDISAVIADLRSRRSKPGN